eukprot:TRINITY_DN3500_c0_g1_i1.p1 TRINITY_DN3500_c0_g1~~TRINITY_DN3500_c0_g1_i1.p1  ORF type:complete len:266 (+),score=68.05 TRINITY_DN3500_c0_g1_i1:71-868(+)
MADRSVKSPNVKSPTGSTSESSKGTKRSATDSSQPPSQRQKRDLLRIDDILAPTHEFEKRVPRENTLSGSTPSSGEGVTVRHQLLTTKLRNVLLKKKVPMSEKELLELDFTSQDLKEMKENPYFHFENGIFSIKGQHDIRNKDQLLDLIRSFPDGIDKCEIDCAYPNIDEDIQDLKAKKLIHAFDIRTPHTMRLIPIDVQYRLDISEQYLKLCRLSVEKYQAVVKELKKEDGHSFIAEREEKERKESSGVARFTKQKMFFRRNKQ